MYINALICDINTGAFIHRIHLVYAGSLKPTSR